MSMSHKKKLKLIITGCNGLIGSILSENLKNKYEILGIDLKQSTKIPSVSINTASNKDMKKIFEGYDVVIDLAAHASTNTPWEKVYANNIQSTYNVIKSASESGIKRVIFASSNHVTGMYENDYPYKNIVSGNYQKKSKIPYITTKMPIRPDSPYGIGKSTGESIGKYFSEKFNTSIICIRIGTVNLENKPVDSEGTTGIRSFATLLTHNDLIQLIEKSINASSDLKYEIFYGVSNNKWRFWDIKDSETKIGYIPNDNAEKWR